MSLEEILKKNYELYDMIFKKLIIIFTSSSLIYFVMKFLDILFINLITQFLFFIILFISFGFALYTSIYLYYKIYNKIRIIILKKQGILDDINFEINNLPDKDIKYALKSKFINTNTYSIIFYRLLKIIKIEDITRLFEVSGRYGHQTVVELKNRKQYNISYYPEGYFVRIKKILEEKKIEVKYKYNILYPTKIFFKTFIISFPILILLVSITNNINPLDFFKVLFILATI